VTIKSSFKLGLKPGASATTKAKTEVNTKLPFYTKTNLNNPVLILN